MYGELVRQMRACCNGEPCEEANCCFNPKSDLDCIEQLLTKAADAIEELSEQRDLALTRLCEWCGVCSKEHRDAWGCDDIARLQELQLPRWIPVTERLPEDGAEVLAWSQSGFAYVDWWIDGAWKVNSLVDGKYEFVTHWMPLPEPPKEET